MKMMMREFEEQFEKIPDLIRCSVGQPSYPADPLVQAAIIQALSNPYQPYPPRNGDSELIAALANKYHVDPAALVITHGASEALAAILNTLFSDGGILLIITPGYPAYFSLCQKMKIETYEWVTDFPDFKLELKKLDQTLLPLIKAVIIIPCGNPTGHTISFEQLEKLAQMCRQWDWTLILDQSYTDFKSHPLPSCDCHCVQLYSFSKSYGLCGLRIGYCFGEIELMKQVQSYVALNTVGVASCIQKGALQALSTDNRIIVEQVKENARKLIELLNRYQLPCVQEPSFYGYFDVSRLLMDAQAFCQRCAIEAQVLFMPGDYFGQHQENRVRVCCAAARFDEALNRLEAFLSKAVKQRH